MREYKQAELFERFDGDILSVEKVRKYIKENAGAIIRAASEKCVKTVMTTRSYELGIACPSLVNHRVIGGHKRGRVIRKKPENDAYTLIGYDSDGKPLFHNVINEYGSEDKYYFFDFDGYTWAVGICDDENSKSFGEMRPYGHTYKWQYDEQGRISYYASMEFINFDTLNDTFSGRVMANIYEYPEDAGEPVICRFYDYNRPRPTPPHLSSILKDKFAAGRLNEKPFLNTDFLYEIYPDDSIKAYYRKDNGYVFSREITSSKRKKSAKPAVAQDSYEKLCKWIDNALSEDIPDDGGIYFDLFSATEDGFGIYLQITSSFDPEDDEWGCDVVWSSEMLMIETNGEMEWQSVLNASARLLRKYFREGDKRNVLKGYMGAGVSFPDGDTEYIYINKRKTRKITENGKEKTGLR